MKESKEMKYLTVMPMKAGYIYKLNLPVTVRIVYINLEAGFDAQLRLYSQDRIAVEATLDAENTDECLDVVVLGDDYMDLKSESNATVDIVGFIEGIGFGEGQEFVSLKHVLEAIKKTDENTEDVI